MEFTMKSRSDEQLEILIDHENLTSTAIKNALIELLPLLEAKATAILELSVSRDSISIEGEQAMLAASMRSAYFLHRAIEDYKNIPLLRAGEITATQIGFAEFEEAADLGAIE